MYRLTYKGKPMGTQFGYEEAAIQAYIRLRPVFLGLGWHKCI